MLLVQDANMNLLFIIKRTIISSFFVIMELVKNMTKKDEKIALKDIIILLIIGLVIWYFVEPNSFHKTFSFLNSKSEEKEKNKVEKTRTILVYMSPSNLESEHGVASNDLRAVSVSEFDFDHNELVVMAGGSNSWSNGFSKEAKIYHFTREGKYDVVDQCYGHQNMGDASTLSYFLDYGKEHYQSDEYIVYLYGHGYGIDGLLPDEVYDDGLSLKELNTGFTNSKLGYPNKTDLIISNSCLIGTIETLENLSYHGKYAITSEEVGWSITRYPLFKMFNELKPDKDLVKFSEEYIDYYKESVKDIKDDTTMTLVDLGEIKNLYDKVNTLFGGIYVRGYYDPIKKFRSKTHQIANDEILDEVDLLTAMEQFSLFYPKMDYAEYRKQFEKTILYRYSSTYYLSGISIWFPYYNPNYEGDYYIGNEYLYEAGSGYRNFVTEFMRLHKEEYGF